MGGVGHAEVTNEGVGHAEVTNEGVGHAEVTNEGVGHAEVTNEGVWHAEVTNEGVGHAEVTNVQANKIYYDFKQNPSEFKAFPAWNLVSSLEKLCNHDSAGWKFPPWTSSCDLIITQRTIIHGHSSLPLTRREPPS